MWVNVHKIVDLSSFIAVCIWYIVFCVYRCHSCSIIMCMFGTSVHHTDEKPFFLHLCVSIIDYVVMWIRYSRSNLQCHTSNKLLFVWPWKLALFFLPNDAISMKAVNSTEYYGRVLLFFTVGNSYYFLFHILFHALFGFPGKLRVDYKVQCPDFPA